MHELDLAFAELASYQEGVASLAQARLLGFTNGAIDHRRRSGRWPVARPGVVRMPGAVDSWMSDLLAGRLVLGENAVAARTTAAFLLGLDGFSDPPLEFVGPRGMHGRSGLVIHTTTRLDPTDVVAIRRPLPPSVRRSRTLRRAGLVHVIRATSASRSIIDLAATLDPEALGNAIDAACRLGLSSPSYLARRLADTRRRGRAGSRLLDEVMLDTGGHSMLERRFLRLVRDAGLPRPLCQAVHAASGRFIARVDFDYAPIPLVVEVSGRRGHSSDRARAHDARRRNELQALGLTVLEFTTSQVLGDPMTVVAGLRHHLRRLEAVTPIRVRPGTTASGTATGRPRPGR